VHADGGTEQDVSHPGAALVMGRLGASAASKTFYSGKLDSTSLLPLLLPVPGHLSLSTPAVAADPRASDRADHGALRDAAHADEGTEQIVSHPVAALVIDRLEARAASQTFHHGSSDSSCSLPWPLPCSWVT